MGKGIFAAYSNPVSADAEEEFNTWYNEVHLKELLAIPGVVSARRYRLDEVNPAAPEHRYMTLYELDTDPGTLLAALGAGQLTSTDTMDNAGAKFAFWVPVD